MSTDVAACLLDGLVDDAGLFPPAEKPLPEALESFRDGRAGPHRRLLGRFLCPASRLPELADQLRPGEKVPLGLVMDTGVTGVPLAVSRAEQDLRIALEVVEIPLSPGADQSAAAHATLLALNTLPDHVQAYLELPRVPGWRDALSLIAARGRGVKLRTGGLVADVFPTEREVAEFIKACVDEHAAFKCTAGLHRAARYRDPRTGFQHQGFLNILAATCQAVAGARLDELTAVLSESDPGALTALLRTVPGSSAALARRHFLSYGCCGFLEPVDDLTALGLLGRVNPTGAPTTGPTSTRPTSTRATSTRAKGGPVVQGTGDNEREPV
jgi:hypothetical protein